VVLTPLFAAMLADSVDWAVLGACLMLAVAVALFISYI